ncbi:hypothetical protein AR457_40230 [Streptomyces agglomeratus]|nr:hypothetical protein AR457_40230 [Streptomyces agglomeratus]OEJ36954.1 hypothetical protein BGK70_00885 [Streptomyces agglomeratus]
MRRFQLVRVFPAEPAAVPPVRRELHELLNASGLADVADTVALAAQELMANAVTHGCREQQTDIAVCMTATCDGRLLRLQVEDPSDKHPCVRAATADEEGGRGLLLVDAFADRWGVEAPSDGGGKAVWMELACGPGESLEAS